MVSRVDAALVLAGGRSARFSGQEKSLARLEGEAMITRVVARVSPLVDTVVVSCRAEQRDGLSDALADVDLDADTHLVFAFDEYPDRGPVYGLQAGLRVVRRECEYGFQDRNAKSEPRDTAVVVACDLPLLEPVLFECLEGYLGETDVVVPETSDGQRHPLAGLYRVTPTLEAITGVGGARDCSRSTPGMFDLLSRLETVWVGSDRLPRGADRMLRNVNTRAELATAESVLEAEDGDRP